MGMVRQTWEGDGEARQETTQRHRRPSRYTLVPSRTPKTKQRHEHPTNYTYGSRFFHTDFVYRAGFLGARTSYELYLRQKIFSRRLRIQRRFFLVTGRPRGRGRGVEGRADGMRAGYEKEMKFHTNKYRSPAYGGDGGVQGDSSDHISRSPYGAGSADAALPGAGPAAATAAGDTAAASSNMLSSAFAASSSMQAAASDTTGRPLRLSNR